MGPPTMGSIFRQGEKKMMQNDLLTLTPQGGGDPGRAEGLYWQGDLDVFAEEGEDSALQGFPFRRPGSGFFKPGAGLELID